MQKALYHLRWLSPGWRWCLAAIFVWSGVSKLRAPGGFAVIIDAFGLMPSAVCLPAAILLAAGEVAVGLALAFNIRGAMIAAAALLIFFILVLAYGIWLGLDIDCGCFGPRSPEQAAFHDLRAALYRDLVFLGLTVAALFQPDGRTGKETLKTKLFANGSWNIWTRKKEEKC